MQESNNGCGVLPRICVLATYFGPFPPWFGLWAATAGANANIDFLVITDQLPEGLPRHVRVLSETLDGVKRRIECAAGGPVALARPYKLCDYRPFFGEAFSDVLEGYAYWGHCDIDLIFGDLEGCLASLDLSAYDKFLPLGHLFLYRNTDEVNGRWRLPLGGKELWRDVIATDDLYAFDERGINEIYLENGFPVYRGHPFADTAYTRKRFILGKQYGNYHKQVFYWKDGKAGRYAVGKKGLVDEEFLYVHFQKKPMSADMVRAVPGEAFYLGANGFFPMEGLDFPRAYQEVNPYFPVAEEVEGFLAHSRARLGLMKRKLLHGRY